MNLLRNDGSLQMLFFSNLNKDFIIILLLYIIMWKFSNHALFLSCNISEQAPISELTVS